MENLDPVADRIVQHDEVLHAALVGECARAARDLDAGAIEVRREPLERRGVGDLPAEEADAFAAVGLDDDALLAVVHAERERGAALVDGLQPKQPAAVRAPVVERLGANS